MKNIFFLENRNFLKWIIFSRAIFATVLMISCLVFSSGENLSAFSQPFLILYNIAGLIFFLSVIYFIWFIKFNSKLILAYCQVIIDTFIITSIIFVTGCYESIFTFLYLVVIIYSSTLLLHKGSLIIATLSSVQYGILIELEHFKIGTPYLKHWYLSGSIDETRIIYRIIIVSAACFSVAVLSDILAKQLKRANQDLKMAREHLKRVEKMAAMDELIAGIAHEINNPLAALSGSIQLLHEDAAPGSYEDKLMQIILRETSRLETIVKEIRLFAKPGTDNACDINIADSIKEIVQLFLKDPAWSKIKITLNLKNNLYVFVDPLHFNQILWNLLKNAAQSIKEDGQIKIGLHSHKNQRVYLTVEDTGTGINAKDAKHIFDPFYTNKPDGTGLGLSIIHRIVDSYNGMIDFESIPGQGSTFTVLFDKKR